MSTAVAVKERPILFSGPMVRALLAGTKTQTRRAVKRQPAVGATMAGCATTGGWCDNHDGYLGCDAGWQCPYGQPGERLWVRETWAPRSRLPLAQIQRPFYRATNGEGDMRCPWKWRPSIHMPRWASRIVLELVDVRAERLQEITEGDAIAEGVEHIAATSATTGGWACPLLDTGIGMVVATARLAYHGLWNQINGAGSWEANPWVWCLTFERVPA